MYGRTVSFLDIYMVLCTVGRGALSCEIDLIIMIYKCCLRDILFLILVLHHFLNYCLRDVSLVSAELAAPHRQHKDKSHITKDIGGKTEQGNLQLHDSHDIFTTEPALGCIT